MKKEQYNIRIEPQLRAAIHQTAEDQNVTHQELATRYLQEGIARDNRRAIEGQTLPVVRNTLDELLDEKLAALLETLLSEMRGQRRQSDSRLAGLIAKTARYAGIGQALIYSFLAEERGVEYADNVFDLAAERIGREIRAKARGEESPQGAKEEEKA